MIWEIVLNNFYNILIGVGLFVGAYLANMAFSLWYNIKILMEPFSFEKLKNSGLKILCFGIGLTFLSLVISTLPEFADTVGWTIPEDYKEVFANLAIIGVFLLASTKYVVEAWNKMKNILFDKIPNVEVKTKK